jgi:4-amino-4-deoxychorismate lyase
VPFHGLVSGFFHGAVFFMHDWFINGQHQGGLSVDDRGLAYGDGHFTTAKVVRGQIQYWPLHLERLKAASKQIKIAEVDWHALEAKAVELTQGCELGVIKIVLTAGSGGRGYSRQGCSASTVICSLHQYPAHYESWQQSGVKLGDSPIKLGLNPMLAGIKHLNRLEQVLIKADLEQQQLADNSLDEVVVCDLHGHIIECNSANIFWYADEQWHTPDLSSSGVNGIMRQLICSHLKNVKQLQATPGDLLAADAVFICNSLLGIAPVISYAEKCYSPDIPLELIRRLGLFSD